MPKSSRPNRKDDTSATLHETGKSSRYLFLSGPICCKYGTVTSLHTGCTLHFFRQTNSNFLTKDSLT
eukprot:6251437-Lingulodinium_polyedra.AAC.1